MHYAIIDIETTGGNPKSSKITEIAIYKSNGIEIIDQLKIFQILSVPDTFLILDS